MSDTATGCPEFRAYNVDFNRGEGGARGFARPVSWADADPAEQIAWCEELSCNVAQAFAVSRNGRAWHRGGPVPEQAGLVHDFPSEMVRLGHLGAA